MSEMETLTEGVPPPSDSLPPGEGEQAADGEVTTPENAEKRILELESSAEELRSQMKEREEQIGRLQASLEVAVTRYRNGILRDNPEIPQHLVTGSTVEELDASLEEARTVVDSVKEHLEEQVPAGAPARPGADVDALSPRQKIEYGIQRRGRTK